MPLSEAVGTRAYALLKAHAKSHGLHVFDSLIAATAVESNLTLVTHNQKDYRMFGGLKLQVPEY